MRATRAQILQGPLTRIPPERQGLVFLVVPHGQGIQYKQVLADMSSVSHVRVIETPEDVVGIGPTRWWIGLHAQETGADKLVMMDDDIDFLVRASPQDWRLVAQDSVATNEMFDAIERRLDDVAMVGISDRAGNNRCGIGGPDDDCMVNYNTRIMRMFGLRTADWLEMEHGRVTVMEDIDLTLQLLRAGWGNVNLSWWVNGQKMANSPGGCSTYRTHQVQDESARRLQDLHGGDIVRLRTKNNKTDAQGLGTRTEVTIMWKRAAAMGSARGA